MEEDIKILEDVLKDKDTKLWIGEQGIQAIENLIARYKELEEKVKTLKSLSNDYNRLWIEKCEEYNSLERKIEKINELNIPVETLIAEFNRLEDLEDDREQLKEQIKTNEDYIKELQKKLTNEIEIKYIHQDYIPKSKVQEKIQKYSEIIYYAQTEEGMAELKDFEYEEAKYGIQILAELIED